MSEENKNIENEDNSIQENIVEEQTEETFSEESENIICEDDIKTPRQKKKIKISLKSYIVSIIAISLAVLMLTYTMCSGAFKEKYEDLEMAPPSSTAGYSEKDVIDYLIGQHFYGEVDREKLDAESLKAYVAATGDIYAAYYTAEELDEMKADGAGKTKGIGINIINSQIDYNGQKISVLKIINVMKDSPAAEHGLRAGDLIVYAGVGDERESVNYLGFDEALRRLKGEIGTIAKFTVFRPNGDKYDEIPFEVEREEVIATSVMPRVYSPNTTVGIVKITSFDLTTPLQFKEAIELLKSKGCDKFVLDVRNNPGGYLPSIAAVLSYFLDKDDVYIRTEDKNGNIKEEKVNVINGYTGDYISCNVKNEEIGMYKNLNMVVLCDENTASAAELFTATFRDYGLAKIVGTTTFGKGKMQTTYDLSFYGLKGAVKLTTHMYYSAKSEGYDGIGIKPDEGCDIPISEEAKKYNIYDRPDEKDNQLTEAVKHFK